MEASQQRPIGTCPWRSLPNGRCQKDLRNSPTVQLSAPRPSLHWPPFLASIGNFGPCILSISIMTGDKLPTIHSLDRPEDLKGLLRQDRGDDCLSCKIVGTKPHVVCTRTKGEMNMLQQLGLCNDLLTNERRQRRTLRVRSLQLLLRHVTAREAATGYLAE